LLKIDTSKFCPLLSSKDSKSPCEPNCQWIIPVEVEYPLRDEKVIEGRCALTELANNSQYLIPDPE
jgi:hypothetical protein